MTGVLKIPLFQFMAWFQERLDQKHTPLLDPLKTLFLTFATLVKQLIATYTTIKSQLEKEQSQLWALGESVIDTSIQILLSMAENIPILLDLTFCQNFAHQFEGKLTLLCSYYHSLSHIEQQSKSNIKKQKQRIVDGINMLYLLTGDIKQQVKQVVHILKMSSDYKKLFSKKLNSIEGKLDQFQQSCQIQNYQRIPQLQKQKAINLLLSINKQQTADKLLQFVDQYFQLISHSCETQIQLQNALEQPIRICNELKTKKKILNYMMQQSNWQSISRQLNLLLKSNFITKQIKKIKVQQFMSFLKTISLKKDQFIDSSFDFQKMQNKIKQLIQTMIQDLKQIEKVDRAELIELLHPLKLKPSNSQLKKKIEIFNDFQLSIYRYYKLNQQIKSLDRFVQTIVAKELKLKVKLVLL